MKGRKPKPTKLKILEGNPGKRALNKNEPEAEVEESLPPAPKELSSTAKREWNRTGPKLHRMGLLTEIDYSALAAYCAAYARWLDAEKAIKKQGTVVLSPTGYFVQNVNLGIANTAMKQMQSFLVEFGMTPSSRSRVAAANIKKKKDEGDPWEKIKKG